MKPSMFLKLDGHDGESEDGHHKGWIDVLSWSYGITQSANSQVGSGSSNAQARFQDVHFLKWIDASSAALMHSCASGRHIAKAELHCTKASGGNRPLEYLIIKMEDIIISTYQTGGSSVNERQIEQVSMNFAKFEVQYTLQTRQGGAGAKPKMTWDIKKGSGSIA